MKKIAGLAFSIMALGVLQPAQAQEATAPAKAATAPAPSGVIGHDGRKLAGAFTTTTLDGKVMFWTINEDESMQWTDLEGHTGTSHHYQSKPGMNCINPSNGPKFCFLESVPSKNGAWMAIRTDTNQGVIVQRLAVAPDAPEAK